MEKICGIGPRGDRTNAQERFGNHPYKLSRLQENNNEKEPCKTSYNAGVCKLGTRSETRLLASKVNLVYVT